MIKYEAVHTEDIKKKIIVTVIIFFKFHYLFPILEIMIDGKVNLELRKFERTH